MDKSQEVVGIIGTGNYGIAIGKRLVHYGFRVVFGSRKPDLEYVRTCFRQDLSASDAKLESSILGRLEVTSIEDAFAKASKVVFLAVRSEVYPNVCNQISRVKQEANKTKILIELSNSLDVENERVSNAQRLKKLLDTSFKSTDPNIQVVKAFNGISAYSMESSFSVQKSVETIPIAGGSVDAKDYLIRFCNQIGYQAYDAGSLELAALRLEQLNNETFRDWQKPTLASGLFLLFNFIWIFVWYFYFPKKPHTFEQYMNGFTLMGHLNKVLGFTSLHMLAFVYLGSPIAGIFQLAYGTKYRRFPALLDWCLKSRKQLGLWAFFYAVLHMILSILVANPAYLDNWYRVASSATATITMFTWNGELAMIFGVLGFVSMALVALSSVNSIAASLNWSEWQFVQSTLGLACLAISFTHTAIMYARFFYDKDYPNYSFVYMASRVKGLGLIFPFLVLAIRFIFAYFPPISRRVDAIRNGSTVSTTSSNKRD